MGRSSRPAQVRTRSSPRPLRSRISTSLAIRRRRRRRSSLAVAGMEGEEEENVGPFRRTSARTRRMATRMASALASSDNRAQVRSGPVDALLSSSPSFLRFDKLDLLSELRFASGINSCLVVVIISGLKLLPSFFSSVLALDLVDFGIQRYYYSHFILYLAVFNTIS